MKPTKSQNKKTKNAPLAFNYQHTQASEDA